jgi:hypothetical protein
MSSISPEGFEAKAEQITTDKVSLETAQEVLLTAANLAAQQQETVLLDDIDSSDAAEVCVKPPLPKEPPTSTPAPVAIRQIVEPPKVKPPLPQESVVAQEVEQPARSIEVTEKSTCEEPLAEPVLVHRDEITPSQVVAPRSLDETSAKHLTEQPHHSDRPKDSAETSTKAYEAVENTVASNEPLETPDDKESDRQSEDDAPKDSFRQFADVALANKPDIENERRESSGQKLNESPLPQSRHVLQKLRGREGKWLAVKKENFISCPRDMPPQDAIKNFLHVQATQLIEKYGQPTDVPVNDMRQYYEQMGLETSPLLFVNPSQQFDRANWSSYQETGFIQEYVIDTGVQGIYYFKKDLGIVVEGRDTIQDEDTAAHELGHSSGVSLINFSRDKKGIYFTIERTGFATRSILDEGRAEWLGMNCLEATVPTEGRPERSFTYQGSTYDLTSRYRTKGSREAPAAMVIELLIGIDPQLAPLIIRADRRPEATKELRKRINAIEPFLFNSLVVQQDNIHQGGSIAVWRLVENHYNGSPHAIAEASDFATSILEGMRKAR